MVRAACWNTALVFTVMHLRNVLKKCYGFCLFLFMLFLNWVLINQIKWRQEC